ncbi:GLPGLI family protein [Pedobacter sp. SD-b]|uniref:GLPGLI family protein n=1 Tax=Pedobacter segetis TaxID=2793069 RepID=A0ABS1BJU2_9SPHI|nr:GLPGLI family protein [Pedobacter segetis]MBK0383031.1 GLPGLI family protein [Pedobacter segetis]
MKNTLYLFIVGLFINICSSRAQFAHFTNSGVIEFEKSANMFAILKPKNGDDNLWQKEFYEKYISNQPQFNKFKSKLYFNTEKSLFVPNQEDNNNAKGGYYANGVVQINEVSTNFKTERFTTKKKVFEEDFLVKDTLRKIDWKITSELRNIAGYNCRRANAIIMDSVYVVAFYTDQIPVSGGPESFTGLPGMILGVALPYEHITWFATKVNDMPVPEKDLAPPIKGKLITLKGLKEKVLSTGDYLKESLKAFLL